MSATCSCCAGVVHRTPVAVDNAPGLSAIKARIGTYQGFLDSMLAELSDTDHPALSLLRTRAPDDPSIALLDAFAVTADVLTFYQERYANENYLRTATELRSLLELARLVGYELSPGVAAHTSLAFTLDTTAGSPLELDLPVGTKVQSMPGPGQQAQTFETIEEITARPEWSAISAQLTEPHLPRKNDTHLWLSGTALNLKPGDPLLIVGPEKLANLTTDNHWEFRRVVAIDVDNTAKTTHVVLDNMLGPHVSAQPDVYALRKTVSLFGYNAPQWGSLPVGQRYSEVDGAGKHHKGIWAGQANKWAEARLPAGTTQIYLDAVYQQIAADSWIVLAHPGTGKVPVAEVFHVTGVAETSHAAFAMAGRASRLEIAGKNIHDFSPRNASVYGQSEKLDLAERPLHVPLGLDAFKTNGRVPGLVAGRNVIVSGPRAWVSVDPSFANTTPLTASSGDTRTLNSGDMFAVDALGPLSGSQRQYTLEAADGFVGTVTASGNDLPWTTPPKTDAPVADLVAILSVDDSDLNHTGISVAKGLTHVYDRRQVTIYGNVAKATHGETVQEVLGNGNAAQPFLKFQVKQPPVTYVAAKVPGGASSTLQVFCNDVPWTEVEELYDQGPTSQVFAERRDYLGNTSILFGDGVSYGARTQSGAMNLRAQYRRGIGSAGNVDAGQLSLLMSRPLGLKAVTNPLAATEGADPATIDDARQNAPLSVATLDRAVSIDDYADFARTFAGIAKASAQWAWNNGERRIILTLAGSDGAPVDLGGDLVSGLATALKTYGEPTVAVTFKTFTPVMFELGLNVLPVEADAFKDTAAAVAAALTDAFSFAERDFGQMVSMSEIIAVVQGVDGVAAANVTALYRSDQASGLNARLAASSAPAELLLIDPASLSQIGTMT